MICTVGKWGPLWDKVAQTYYYMAKKHKNDKEKSRRGLSLCGTSFQRYSVFCYQDSLILCSFIALL